ncbi:hypothetical protein HK103_004241 [Boothiomyces macroporosus]|uniref:Mevalonate kinase n=1 Tax=Boothiomyces macroporosus TaxID=261099 RepID=A0AAD5UHD9_9FUNG|nr:hypothetical protein HK103_004241 [Boothiomyces macroporosus]
MLVILATGNFPIDKQLCKPKPLLQYGGKSLVSRLFGIDENTILFTDQQNYHHYEHFENVKCTGLVTEYHVRDSLRTVMGLLFRLLEPKGESQRHYFNPIVLKPDETITVVTADMLPIAELKENWTDDYCSFAYLKTPCNYPIFQFNSKAVPKVRSWIENGRNYFDLLYSFKEKNSFEICGKVNDWLQDYLNLKDFDWFPTLYSPQLVEERVYARVGLIGNPSDGFNGKCISATIKNYYATVKLESSPDSTIKLLCDEDLPSISAANHSLRTNGYYGTNRLFLATLKQFTDYTNENDTALPEKGFRLSVKTNIPKQVGLAGSSAIVIGILKCLVKYYNVTIPPEILSTVALNVELVELGIQAGYQDRVVQSYGGTVYMDFTNTSKGYGIYEKMNVKLPRMWLAYNPKPKESGQVHNNVKQRYLEGDFQVTNVMKQLGQLTDEFYTALKTKSDITKMIKKNFELRKSIYSISPDMQEMISIAEKYGNCAKFSGSGGCCIGIGGNEEELQKEMEQRGFVFTVIEFE